MEIENGWNFCSYFLLCVSCQVYEIVLYMNVLHGTGAEAGVHFKRVRNMII